MKLDITKETEIISFCALRFDGYKYQKATGINSKKAIDKLLAGESLETLDSLATFFFLQRALCKFDLQYKSANSKFWKIFRQLFIEHAESEIPEEYRGSTFKEWQDKYASDVSQIKDAIQEIHLNTDYEN